MSKNIQNSQTENVSTVKQKDTLYNPDRLINLSTWSVILSWFFFVAGAVFIVIDLLLIIASFKYVVDSIFDLGYEVNYGLEIFVLGLICIFFGLILRIVSEGVFLLMDIEHNTHRD